MARDWLDRRSIFKSGAALWLTALARRLTARSPAGLVEPRADHAKLIAEMPGERLTTRGERAFDDWQRLRAAGTNRPVVIGDDDHLNGVAEQSLGFEGETPPRRSTAQILDAARAIKYPEDYIAYVRAEEKEARDYLAKLPREQRLYTAIEVKPDGTSTSRSVDSLEEPEGPEVGEWPEEPPERNGLSVATGLVKENKTYVTRPLERANILVLPTTDFTEVPAILNWGGWNACPPPEYHVAAFRSWRERYGAELVGMDTDTLNLRVKRRPASRDEALALAREFYDYCPDIVQQGTETLSVLAAGLMNDDWWYFWWD